MFLEFLNDNTLCFDDFFGDLVPDVEIVLSRKHRKGIKTKYVSKKIIVLSGKDMVGLFDNVFSNLLKDKAYNV